MTETPPEQPPQGQPATPPPTPPAPAAPPAAPPSQPNGDEFFSRLSNELAGFSEGLLNGMGEKFPSLAAAPTPPAEPNNEQTSGTGSEGGNESDSVQQEERQLSRRERFAKAWFG